MANDENLIPYKKGESGNLKGRPKGSKNRATIAKRWLEILENAKNPISGKDEELSQEDMITLAMLSKARSGDVNAYKALMDSAFGSPIQQIDQTIKEQPLFPDVQED
tara:strand:+ start:90 stop:410 length:321 start_codon:yes stop_codon:yes gene_type:complete